MIPSAELSTTPDLLAQVHTYIEAWNRHDPAGIVATFSPGGTYQDPTTAGPVTGDAIGDSASGLFAMLPDVRFEVIRIGMLSPATVVLRWQMIGINTGPIAGLPPTGNSCSLPGVDLIEVGPEGILSVDGFYDRQIVSDQLGLKTHVLPDSQGPFRFGLAASMTSGRTVTPGGFSMTRLGTLSGEPPEPQVFNVAAEMQSLPGFLSWIGVDIGGQNYTITSWEAPEDAAGMMRLPAHRKAVKALFDGDENIDGTTSIWRLDRANRHWVRCPSCKSLAYFESPEARCACGASLPELTPFW